MALGGVLKLLGHVLGGSHWCAEDGEPLLFAWQGAAANPHIGAQCVHVRWGDAGRIPNSRVCVWRWWAMMSYTARTLSGWTTA